MLFYESESVLFMDWACDLCAAHVLISIAYVMFPAAFLILYYAVWFRYFMGGREISLLSCSFFFVPMPLAA